MCAVPVWLRANLGILVIGAAVANACASSVSTHWFNLVRSRRRTNQCCMEMLNHLYIVVLVWHVTDLDMYSDSKCPWFKFTEEVKSKRPVVFLFSSEVFLRTDRRQYWIMTEAGTDSMHKSMSPVSICRVLTHSLNSAVVLSLFRPRPEPSEEDSSWTYTALCCRSHNMHALSPLQCLTLVHIKKVKKVLGGCKSQVASLFI